MLRIKSSANSTGPLPSVSQGHIHMIFHASIIQDKLNSAQGVQKIICKQSANRAGFIQVHAASAAPVPSVRKEGHPHSA